MRTNCFFLKILEIANVNKHEKKRYIFFDKMAAVGHFGCPKFTFDGKPLKKTQNKFFKFLIKHPSPPPPPEEKKF